MYEKIDGQHSNLILPNKPFVLSIKIEYLIQIFLTILFSHIHFFHFSGTLCKPLGVTMDTRCKSGEEASASGEFLVGAGRCPAGT